MQQLRHYITDVHQTPTADGLKWVYRIRVGRDEEEAIHRDRSQAQAIAYQRIIALLTVQGQPIDTDQLSRLVNTAPSAIGRLSPAQLRDVLRTGDNERAVDNIDPPPAA